MSKQKYTYHSPNLTNGSPRFGDDSTGVNNVILKQNPAHVLQGVVKLYFRQIQMNIFNVLKSNDTSYEILIHLHNFFRYNATGVDYVGSLMPSLIKILSDI